MISQERLREVLDYNPETGVLTRKVRTSNRIKVGDQLGHLRPDGYLQAFVGGRMELLHRVAFLWAHGFLPEEVDHINGDRSDNRLSNLRAASKTTNQHNRRVRKDAQSGVKNVSFCSADGLWVVRIRDGGGRRHHIGTFRDFALACSAAKHAAEKYHKEFARAI